MITSTHVVTNALLARKLDLPHAKWFTLGGLAPDVGLILLTAGAAVYFPQVEGMTRSEAMDHAFGTLFFEDPAWLVIQNTLHSPVVVTALAVAGKVAKKPKVTAFALGCLLHAVMDIPVHHDDGPLVFFPFNWDFRVQSPVSYWDRDHYGQFVAPIDIGFTIAGGAYLLTQWWKGRRK